MNTHTPWPSEIQLANYPLANCASRHSVNFSQTIIPWGVCDSPAVRPNVEVLFAAWEKSRQFYRTAGNA